MRLFQCILFGLMVASTSASAQLSNPCLKLLNDPDDSTWQNPDSIYVDSCPASSTYLHLFAKETFSVQFFYGSVLPVPGASPDTIIEVEWTQIDTAYSATRAGFDSLQQRFGHFILKNTQPNIVDTNHIGSKIFALSFDSIVDVNVVSDSLKTIPLVEYAGYSNRSGILSGITNINNNDKTRPSIIFNATTSEITINDENLLENNTLDIFSTTGQLIYHGLFTKQSPSLKVANLPQSCYVVQINGATAGKLLVTH